MAEKKFLSWIGFKGDTPTTSSSAHKADTSLSGPSGTSGTSGTTPSHGAFDRIRELETQLADMRSRRDISSLTKEEFEILATETATSLIKAAQARERTAIAAAERALAEATRIARQATEEAESKAKAILSGAENRSRKYLETAESEAAEKISEATLNAEKIIDNKRREAATLASAAKREAERLIAEAAEDVTSFKSWLTSAISESERLHRIQSQSLASAEEAIRQTRQRLTTAFEKLAALGSDIDSSLGEDNLPKENTFARSKNIVTDATVPSAVKKAPVKNKAVAKKKAPVKKKAVAKKSTRKSVGKKPKRK